MISLAFRIAAIAFAVISMLYVGVLVSVRIDDWLERDDNRYVLAKIVLIGCVVLFTSFAIWTAMLP